MDRAVLEPKLPDKQRPSSSGLAGALLVHACTILYSFVGNHCAL